MINMNPLKKIFVTAVLGVLLAACGPASPPQTAGIDRGGVGSGPITSLGSIWVNGVRYTTNNADVYINGELSTDSNLAVGQVVVVEASIPDSGLAIGEAVVYESNLQGPTSAIDVLNSRFVALGQMVIADSRTSFGPGITPADLSGLALDDVVEISGLVETSGLVRATRIERETDIGYQIQLSGTVTDLVSGLSFKIGDQLIDYSGASSVEGFPGGLLSDDDKVRVVGDVFGASGEILATSVGYRGDTVLTEVGDEGEVEGLITDFVSPFSFHLAGFDIVTNAQTDYSGGTAADLANNIRIEVEGAFDSSGSLIAEQIEFREEGESFIEAVVDSAGVSGDTVSVFGITVETTALTSLEDKSDTELRFFDLSDISSGDVLRIDGSWNGSRVIATRIERVNPEDKIEIKGPVSSSANPAFTLLGKVVTTDAVQTEFEGDQTSFFNDLAACEPNCIVEAEWFTADAPWTIAKGVKLED